jgi:hypothetical protein
MLIRMKAGDAFFAGGWNGSNKDRWWQRAGRTKSQTSGQPGTKTSAPSNECNGRGDRVLTNADHFPMMNRPEEFNRTLEKAIRMLTDTR